MRSDISGLVPVMSIAESLVTSIIEADLSPAASMSFATTALRSYSSSLPLARFSSSSPARPDSAL